MASTKTLTTAFAVMAALAAAAQEKPVKLKSAPGLDKVEANCSGCHSLDYIPMNSPFLDGAMWNAEVTKMIRAFGAPISDDDAKAIVDYLAKNYGGIGVVVDQLQKSIEETTTPTSRQPVEETTTPTSRRELKGKRHTFVRHPGSGNERTSDHAVGGSYYHYRYFGRGYTYWRPLPYTALRRSGKAERNAASMLRVDQYEDAIKGGWLIETPREPPRVRAR